MSKLRKFICICLVSLFAVNAQVTVQGQGGEAEVILARAIGLHQAGDVENAIREYQSYLVLEPRNVEARSNLGAAFAKLGRYKEAIEQYQQSLAIDHRNTSIRFNLAIAFYKATQISQAVKELTQVVATQRGNLNAMLLLADCHLRLGQNEKVIELLAPLEATQSADKALTYLLGTALIRDNQTERGQRVLDRILRDGESAEARLLLGTAQLLAHDYAGAVKDLARAVELNPKLPSAHSYYGRALLDTGNHAEATEAFRRELAINPNDFEANLYMGVLLKQEQKKEALTYFERALSVRPGALEVRHQIGTLLFASGKIAEAQAMLEEVVKEAPNFVEAHVALATAYYRLKRKEDGDRHRAIVQKLTAEAQARQPGAQQGTAADSPGENPSETEPAMKPAVKPATAHPR